MRRLFVAGVLAVLGVVSVLASTALAGGAATGATVQLRGATTGTVKPVYRRSSFMPTQEVKPNRAAGVLAVPFHSLGKPDVGTGAGAPVVDSSSAVVSQVPQGVPAPWLGASFNGLSDKSQSNANFGDPGLGDLTPPDQGLCTGFTPVFGGPIVVEMVNDAIIVTTVHGVVIQGPEALTSFFGDANAFSDPKCYFDPATGVFFFTIISFVGPDTVTDVGVQNGSSFVLYQFDSSNGGTEFGDQPHVGFDKNGFYIATDQFGSLYNGAMLQAISKPDLVNQVAANYVQFNDISAPNGFPVLTMQPAFYARAADAGSVEYLLNSFPINDAFFDPQATYNQLGFWWVTNDSQIDSNPGAVTLNGKLIASKTYALPVPAASTGDGSTTLVTSGALTIPVYSEPFLNPDDDRMEQVELISDRGQPPMLYTSLSTAIGGGLTTVDGAEWFVVSTAGFVANQGYARVPGKNMLYPVLFHERSSNSALVFTLTSPGLNPSAAVMWFPFSNFKLPQLATVATGADAHLSFAFPLFDTTRWGDYSAAVLDPGGLHMWMATEYIPSPTFQAPFDNWGTFVQQVQ